MFHVEADAGDPPMAFKKCSSASWLGAGLPRIFELFELFE